MLLSLHASWPIVLLGKTQSTAHTHTHTHLQLHTYSHTAGQ